MKNFTNLFFVLALLCLAAGTIHAQVSFVKGFKPYTIWNIVEVNGMAYFFVSESQPRGIQLWKSDGTEAGTVMVKDLEVGISSYRPTVFANVNGVLFFTYDDGTHGAELWKSDGTETGTVMVKDINTGDQYPYYENSSSPTDLINYNGTLFFAADDGKNGRQLWKSDGTEAGTVMVKDGYQGQDDLYPEAFYPVNFNGTLFFANEGDLWKSDGTDEGTVLVRDINPDGTSSLTDLVNANGTLFFYGNDYIRGNELWKSDGTKAGTMIVKDINPGSNSSLNHSAAPGSINSTLFFAAVDGKHGGELWKSDGTEAGTVLVKDIYPGKSSPHSMNTSEPQAFTNVGGTMFFIANDGVHGHELWKSDGTKAGTVMVKDINPDGNGLSEHGELINLNGTLYFAAYDGTHGTELWKSDGTEAGTVLAKDIYPGKPSSNPYALFNINGVLFFPANHFVNTGLWKYDPNEPPCNEPEPAFSVLASVCFGDTVTFIDNSANVAPGATYLWNFGDGDTSTVAGNVSHVYDSIANDDGFTASLTITQGGCTKSFVHTVRVHPEVWLFLPFSTVEDTTAAFALTGGSPAGGTYSGEGVTNGMFDPAAVGTGAYEITYTYTDTAGCSNAATEVLKVRSTSQPEAVVSFTLINADTDTDILELTDGMQLYAHELPIARLSIRANTNSSIIGSVFMSLRGDDFVRRTENIAPYTLFGDENGNYQGKPFEAGNYRLYAAPYYGENQTGRKGKELRLNFSIIEKEEPISLMLVNTATQQDLFPLNDQSTIDLSETGTQIGIRAEVATNGNVLQTRFALEGDGFQHIQYEGSLLPISVFGDTGNKMNPWPAEKLNEGQYSLSTQSSVSKKDEIEMLSRTIEFTVIGGQNQNIQTSNINSKLVDKYEKEIAKQYGDPMMVYPNPFTKDVKIQISDFTNEDIELHLIDLYGRTVFLKNMKIVAGRGELNIEDKNIPAGTYILKVIRNEHVELIKLIKQN